MTFIQSIKNRFKPQQTKDLSTPYSMLLPYGDVGANWSLMNSFGAYLAEGYELNPYVYRAVNYVANSIAGVPWVLIQTNGEEELELTNHPLLSLLNRPNPQQGRAGFIAESVAYYLIEGNSYILRIGPDDLTRPPKELRTLRPDLVQLRQNMYGEPRYQFTPNGTNGDYNEFGADQVLHLMTLNPRDPRKGLSPLRAASRSIDLSNKAKDWNASLLDNAGKPSGTLEIQGRLSDAEIERLKAQFADEHGGSRNAGKPVVLTGGMKFTPHGFGADELAWIEGQKLTANEIALVFGVPPVLLSQEVNAAQANYKEARLSFYLETVLPQLDYWQDELNNWLTPLFGDNLRLAYDADQIEALADIRQTQENQTAMVWERLGVAYTNGLITLNEARQAAGLAPIEDVSADTIQTNNQAIPQANQTQKALPTPHEQKAIPIPMTNEELSVARMMEGFFDEQINAGLHNLPE